MADLTDLQAAGSTKIVGSDSTGLETNAVGADANGNMQVINPSEGPVTPGTVASKSALIGGQYNTSLPTLTNGQQVALQTDSSGRLLTVLALSNDTNYGTVGANTLRTASQIGNATGAADFAAGNSSAQTLRVVVATNQAAIPASQSGTWTVQPGNTANTTPWLVTDSSDGPVTPGAVASKSSLAGGQFNTALPTLTNTQQASLQVDSSGRLIIAPLTSTSTTTAAEDHNYGTVGANTLRTASQVGNATGAADFNAGATGAQTLRVVANQGAANTHANAWFTRLTDGTDDSGVTPSGDLQTADIINVNGQYRAQSVTTSAAEALGAASILTNRKSLSVCPTNGTVYWGYSNAVTTSSGTPIFKNQTVSWSIGANVHVYLIAGSTVDCRITEGS